MVEAYGRKRDAKMKEFRSAIVEQFELVHGRSPASNMETLGPAHEAIMCPIYDALGVHPISSKLNAFSTIADATGHLFTLWNAIDRSS